MSTRSLGAGCALLLVGCRGEAPAPAPPPAPSSSPWAAAATAPARVVREEVAAGDVRLYSGTIADLDGDGTLELAAGGFVTGGDRSRATVFIYRQAGDAWNPVANGGWLGGGGGNGSSVRNVEVADLDGDGTPEVIALGRVGATPDEASARLVVMSLRDGVLVDRAKVEWKAGTYTHGYGLAIGDLDRDGRAEIVTTGFLFEGASEHGFVRSWSFANDALALRAEARLAGTAEKSTRINDVAIGDLDGDGRAEVVTAGRYGPFKAHGTNGDVDARHEHGDLAVWTGETLALRTRHAWLEGSSLRIRALAISDLDARGTAEIVVGGQTDHDGKPCLGVFAYAGGRLALRAKAIGDGAGEIKDVLVSGTRIIATGPAGAKPARQGDVSAWRLAGDELVREETIVSQNAGVETRARAAVIAPDGHVLTIGHAKTGASMIGQLLSWPIAGR